MDHDFEVQVLGERLKVLEAMQLAQRRPQDLVQLIAESTADEALGRLQAEWGLDDGQAHAVLDLQIRRFTVDFAARLDDEIASLKEHKRRLADGEEVD